MVKSVTCKCVYWNLWMFIPCSENLRNALFSSDILAKNDIIYADVHLCADCQWQSWHPFLTSSIQTHLNTGRVDATVSLFKKWRGQRSRWIILIKQNCPVKDLVRLQCNPLTGYFKEEMFNLLDILDPIWKSRSAKWNWVQGLLL